jgi:cytochrome c-type protein NapC
LKTRYFSHLSEIRRFHSHDQECFFAATLAAYGSRPLANQNLLENTMAFQYIICLVKQMRDKLVTVSICYPIPVERKFPMATQAVVTLVLLTVALIGLLTFRPSLTAAQGGKILAFIAFFILPVVATVLGASIHLDHSKSTSFCLSCHVMEAYGKSLRIDEPGYIPASHFQNNRIPRDQACFTCHTDYTMFGDIHAKIRGLKHLYVYYFKEVSPKLALYEPYKNRECLHCHANARSFEEKPPHNVMKAQLTSNQMSCLSCHNKIHNIAQLDKAKMWKGPAR